MAKKKGMPKEEPRSAGSTNRTDETSRPDWSEAFLCALRDCGTILHACAAAGISRTAVYHRRDTDSVFARDLALALEDSTDVLEAEARKRAKEGSDTLLSLLLKAYRPERFKDRVEHSGSTRVTLSAETLSDDQLAAIAAGQ